MERLFKLKEHNTDVRTEITAGITTFLSMVYILAVNPNILSAAGMNPSAVFTATAVSGAIATLSMAFSELSRSVGIRNGVECIFFIYGLCRACKSGNTGSLESCIGSDIRGRCGIHTSFIGKIQRNFSK